MGPRWVALHKNISAEARFDGKLGGGREGPSFDVSLSRLSTHSLCVCLTQDSTHAHGLSPACTGVCLSQLRGSWFVEICPLSNCNK